MSSPRKKTQITLTVSDNKGPDTRQRNARKSKFDNNQPNSSLSTPQTPLKLTLKIGGQKLGEKCLVKPSAIPSTSTKMNDDFQEENYQDALNEFDDDEDEEMIEEENENEQVKDEEEEWLDALEEGRLHEVDDELKKIRDPKLMTARQRALLENKSLKKKEEAMKLLATQSQTNQSNEIISEEMMQRKMLKARRRRQQAEEKKEKDKKQTIERLLRKKQEAARIKKKKKQEMPRVTYRNNQNGIFICLPIGVPFEFQSKSNQDYYHQSMDKPKPESVKCARDGCLNVKKYTCSKTKLPLCSLECYKQCHKQQSMIDLTSNQLQNIV